MPLQATSGAASYDAFGGGVPAVPNYIEDVFATHLYTGNGSTQTISNGIDLSTKGGLVWIKSRNQDAGNLLSDTSQGTTKFIISNTTGAQQTDAGGVTAFNSNGFSLGSSSGFNGNTYSQVSWTFREQPKFFDVVTFTGDYTAKTISHNLGSIPGTIIVKSLNNASGWYVYHRSLGATKYLTLQTTNGELTNSTIWNDTEPTSTQFSVGTNGNVNGDGTYVAYLFAHDAGGFGLTGTDNVISCGSFTADAFGRASVTLGYEPQWVLVKSSSGNDNWVMIDVMRGMPAKGGSNSAVLYPNTSAAESSPGYSVYPNATGFDVATGSPFTYIYIAIRKGPMKVPTDATKVFIPTYGDNDGVAPAFVTNFPVDLGVLGKSTTGATSNRWASRLTGTAYLASPSTAAEATGTAFKFDFQNGWVNSTINYTSAFSWNFRRAPSFFDEVCYTGTGSATTFNHNLGVAPELMIVKARNNISIWSVYSANQGATKYARLNTNAAFAVSSSVWNDTAPTSSVFTVGVDNSNTYTYVAYLFASCAGVSKCGTFTGNGSSQTINCGFTGGARFVMIKATSTTGDWMVADSARGIVSGSDPYLELNNTNAEVTGEDWLDTDSTGFVVNEVSGSNANTNGVTYIYLAIA